MKKIIIAIIIAVCAFYAGTQYTAKMIEVTNVQDGTVILNVNGQYHAYDYITED